MDSTLLDTDMLSEILKKRDQNVMAAARTYLLHHRRFAFSAMTQYEVVRGMKSTGAVRQLSSFLATAGTSDVFPVSISVLMRAADLWAEAHKSGHPRNDADIIIAATALEEGRVLATGNKGHFAWITGLRISDWRTAE